MLVQFLGVIHDLTFDEGGHRLVYFRDIREDRAETGRQQGCISTAPHASAYHNLAIAD